MNRLSINDCECRSLENTKTETYECIQNEDLLNESINKEITTGNECNVFIKLLKNDVGEKKIREWEGQNNCDIEIRCGEFKTKAHSEVLSNVSDYFKANINYNKDVQTIFINREFVSPDVLNDVICYAYTGMFEISSNNVQDSIATASYLQVKIILDECEKFMIKNVDDSSAISLLPFANRYDLSSLIETIVISISENFDSLVDRNAFTRLSHDEFKFLLMDRNLSVFRKGIPVDNPEIHIIEAVGKTLTANQDDDVSTIKDILSAIRFSDLPKSDLNNLYQIYPVFQILDRSFFLNTTNSSLLNRTFSKPMKCFKHSIPYASHSRRKFTSRLNFMSCFKDITDVNDRPRKVWLWVTRWEGFIVIGGIRVNYESGENILHGILPKAKHSIISEHEFVLDENEVITNISIRSGVLIDSLSFDTNYGRTYGPYGSDGGFPSSASPPQKRGYFHSFHGMVYKGRYEYFIANIEFTWVVFETHNTDSKEPSIHSNESWYCKPRSSDRNSPLEASVCYESDEFDDQGEIYDNAVTISLID
ncbi:uncharacterized protein [Mytilus edulis]|uniref:uncharacterized protein n=1 Tax=Mytilus edulis TaxID=6550 RepID=UPI0039F0B264